MSFLEDLGVSIGPAMNTFGQYYQMGLENKRQKMLDEQRKAIEEENRAIRMDQLKMEKQKFEHEIKSMGLQDRRAAQDDAMREIQLLEGRPAPNQQLPPDQGYGPTVEMPGQHPMIQVPRIQEGQAPIAVRPQTDIQVLAKAAAAAAAQRHMETAGAVEKERQIRALPPAAEGMVQLPPQMGGGAQPKSTAELLKTVYTEQQAGARNAADIAARKEIEAGKAGKGGPPMSGETAKVLTVAETGLQDLAAWEKKIKAGRKATIAGAITGADREAAVLLEQLSDKIGRLRSGGAISKDEEARFRDVMASWKDLITGTDESAMKSITGLRKELMGVAGDLKAGRRTMDLTSAGLPTGAAPPKRLKFNPQTGMLE